MYECACCFGEQESGNDVVWCQRDHTVCNDCVIKGMGIALGTYKDVFTCPSVQSDGKACKSTYTTKALRRAVDDINLLTKYEKMVARKQVREALQADQDQRVFECPSCDNMYIVEQRTMYVQCECGKNTCCTCGKEAHQGHCELDDDTDMDDATRKFLMQCDCGTRFIRGDGCNHVTCTTCGEHWCWICKQRLDAARPYDHFIDNCRLYGERDDNGQVDSRAQVAQVLPDFDQMQQEIDQLMPDVNAHQGDDNYPDNQAGMIVDLLDQYRPPDRDIGGEVEGRHAPPLRGRDILDNLVHLHDFRQVEVRQCTAITRTGRQCTHRSIQNGRCGKHRNRQRFIDYINQVELAI